ncbi:unnamed protein product [Boreogadus saida]
MFFVEFLKRPADEGDLPGLVTQIICPGGGLEGKDPAGVEEISLQTPDTLKPDRFHRHSVQITMTPPVAVVG